MLKQLIKNIILYMIWCISIIGCGSAGSASSVKSYPQILDFSLNGTPGVITGNNIAVNLPYGSDATSLVATFTTTGHSVVANGVTQFSGITPNNFTSPVTYTVTAADGTSYSYTVYVTVATYSEKAITLFALNGTPGVITGNNIAVNLPYGSDATSLVATFTTTGHSVVANGVTQFSGITPNNFTSPVTYTVTAADGTSYSYTVYVTVATYSEKAITLFALNGTPGVITGNNIAVNLPYGSDATSLVATFTTTGHSVVANGVTQFSDVTPNNFTSPVTYTVTAADSTSYSYTVYVTVATSSEKDITLFALNGTSGVITGNNIAVNLPYGSDATSLVATFTTTGQSVVLNGFTQFSGITPNNFTSPVTYTVTAADGTSYSYTVYVTVATSSEKDITLFALNGTSGVITGNNIAVNLPYGSDATSLVATFTTTGQSVVANEVIQFSGVTPNNFTSPVTYTVTAADGTSYSYTIYVTVAVSSEKDITLFALNGTSGVITGNNIVVYLPLRSNTPNLIATFTTTGQSVVANGFTQFSGVTPNKFTSPVIYTVTAADGTSQNYNVSIVRSLMYDIAVNDSGLFVAVGYGGLILTSPDGHVWTQQNSGISNRILDVTCSNSGLCVAIGWGVRLTSSDGYVWTDESDISSSLSSSITVNNSGLFIIVSRSGEILSSPDGHVWTRVRDNNGSLYGVTVNKSSGSFIAVGTVAINSLFYDYILTSPDGYVWTSESANISQPLRSVTVNNDGLFVALSSLGDTLTSLDGMSWGINRTLPTWSLLGGGSVLNAVSISSTIFSNGNLYAGGHTTNNGAVWVWDSTSWSMLGGNVIASAKVVDAITINNGNLYASGVDLNGSGAVWIWGGNSWSMLGGNAILSSVSINTIIFSNGNLYAGGYTANGSGAVWVWDGNSWSMLGGQPIANNVGVVSSMAFNNSNLYIGGTSNNGECVWMWDGSSWSKVGSSAIPNAATVRSIAFNNNHLYAGGSASGSGGAVWEWDGSSWSQLGTNLSTLGEINSVIFNNNILYAGGSGSFSGATVFNWTGASWSSIGGAYSDMFAVNDIVFINNVLYYGGLRNSSIPSGAVAVLQ